MKCQPILNKHLLTTPSILIPSACSPPTPAAETHVPVSAELLPVLKPALQCVDSSLLPPVPFPELCSSFQVPALAALTQRCRVHHHLPCYHSNLPSFLCWMRE